MSLVNRGSECCIQNEPSDVGVASRIPSKAELSEALATMAHGADILARVRGRERFRVSVTRRDVLAIRYVAEPTSRNSEAEALQDVADAARALGYRVVLCRGYIEVTACALGVHARACDCQACEDRLIAVAADLDAGEQFAGQRDRVAA